MTKPGLLFLCTHNAGRSQMALGSFGVAFSPDGHTLASGSTDHTIRLWPTPRDATVATVCSKLTSNISHQQCHYWISPIIGYITLCPACPYRGTEID